MGGEGLGGSEAWSVGYCDINCLFLCLCVPRLVILTLYYNIKTLRTLSVNAKQRYFYHRQPIRFIILNRQSWLNTIYTLTRQLISSHHFKQHNVFLQGKHSFAWISNP